MTNLALLLEANGNLVEAEPLFRQALEGREASLGASNLQTLSSVHNLALLLEAQGEAQEALEARARGRRTSLTLVSAKGLASLLKPLGESVSSTFSRRFEAFLRRFGGFLRHQDKFSEAEPLFRRALEGHEKKLGREHPLTLRSMAPCWPAYKWL